MENIETLPKPKIRKRNKDTSVLLPCFFMNGSKEKKIYFLDESGRGFNVEYNDKENHKLLVLTEDQRVRDIFFNRRVERISGDFEKLPKIIRYNVKRKTIDYNSNNIEQKTESIKNFDEKYNDNQQNNKDISNDHSELESVLSDIKYWGNSETIKFRYERNIFGFNLWSETRDIWGIMRRVRSFFQEKTNEYFNADNYQKLWNNDRKKLLEQCKKMNWIRDVLQEKIQFGCDKNFNKNKPWIDQLFYTQQKKEIISYIKEDLSIKISSESAINNWSDKKNLNDLIERVKKCNHQGETKISWWTRTTNKIRNYFKNTK